MAALWDNDRLESLLGNFKLGGHTIKKTVTGVALPCTHYSWLCGYNPSHPSFKCAYKKTGHVMNDTRATIQGGSDKNNPAWQRIRKEYVENKISNVNCSDITVISRGCINSGCSTHCSIDHVIIIIKLPVLHGICVGQLDSRTMRSTHTSHLPLPQLSLSACSIHILPTMKVCCLISIRQLCGEVFAVNFNTKNVFLRK